MSTSKADHDMALAGGVGPSRRIADEAGLIAEAKRRLEAGDGISGDALEAWLDAYETTDGPVPLPQQSGSPTCRT